MSEEFQIIGTDSDLEKLSQMEEQSEKYKEECLRSERYKSNVEELTKQVSDLKLQLNQMRVEKEELRDYFDTTIEDLKSNIGNVAKNSAMGMVPPNPPPVIKPMKLFKNKSSKTTGCQTTPIFTRKETPAITTQPKPPIVNVISRNSNSASQRLGESIYNTANSIYRKTAEVCKCTDCLNHHRYADGYCHVHRYMRLNLV